MANRDGEETTDWGNLMTGGYHDVLQASSIPMIFPRTSQHPNCFHFSVRDSGRIAFIRFIFIILYLLTQSSTSGLGACGRCCGSTSHCCLRRELPKHKHPLYKEEIELSEWGSVWIVRLLA